MDIFELLKQLNKIEPDKNYTLISRHQILNQKDFKFWSIKPKISIIYSLAFTFAIIVIIWTGFWAIQFLTPKFEALNPQAIKAEAETIDFQIELSKIIYNTPLSSRILNSTLNSILTPNHIEPNPTQTTSTKTNKIIDQNPILSASSEATMTLDEILDYLSK